MERRENNNTPCIPRCCCGSSDCAFLAHNVALLEGLERDVFQAGQLGQALLLRHEEYVADSERERYNMLTTIETLEKEKLELEEENARSIEENRNLIKQLNELNSQVAESDSLVQRLTKDLRDSEEEFKELANLSKHTENLHKQLQHLEEAQLQLHESLEDKTEEAKSASSRLHKAESKIKTLEDEVSRIEKALDEERRLHNEVLEKMQQRMKAESSTIGKTRPSADTVSGEDVTSQAAFEYVDGLVHKSETLGNEVENLQAALKKSFDEIEYLRNKLAMHEPVSVAEGWSTPTLQKELGLEPVVNREIHIHHHFHTPGPAKEGGLPRGPSHRRPRRRKQVVVSSQHRPAPSTGSATIPSNVARWSNATTLAPSSLPGSPLSSSYRTSSVLEPTFSDITYDSSRPTSPESVGPNSPTHSKPRPGFSQRSSAPTARSVSTPLSLLQPFGKSPPVAALAPAVSPQEDVFLYSPSMHPVIPEETETISSHLSMSPCLAPDEVPSKAIAAQLRARTRRVPSHESLISISGMDIHTLQSRPSQLYLSSSPPFTSPPPVEPSQPVLTHTVTPEPSMALRYQELRSFNRSILIAGSRRGEQERHSSGIAKKVGGWVLGKWTTTSSSSGTTPNPPGQLHAQPVGERKPSAIEKKRLATKDGAPLRFRSPGINQSGPLLGLFDPIPPTPIRVEATIIDEEALVDSLQGL